MGTNAGFVTEAPTEDPNVAGAGVDNLTVAIRDDSPGDATVTELGYYINNATQEANWEMGIYTHDAVDGEPEDLLDGATKTNAKGTDAGWKNRVGLNISIDASTIYWIACQLDNTQTASEIAYLQIQGEFNEAVNPSTTLPDPTWPGSTSSGDYIFAYYALYTDASVATQTAVNIGDTWKSVAAVKVNVGDVWKDVNGMQVNIGDTWKEVF